MNVQFNLFDVDKIIEIEQDLHSFTNAITLLQIGGAAQFKNCTVSRNRFYEVELGNLYHELFHSANDSIQFLKQIDFL